MIIYKDEASVEGLAEQIAQSRVISYTMPLSPWTPDEMLRLKNNTAAKEIFKDFAAGGANDSDLYYTKSILVTTNWNKNTDVFDKVETWMARSTPTHKPTNVEHDEKQLVGHITDCFAMTTDNQIIPDNIVIDSLPDVYHLVNGAVIYRGWRDQELATRANKLIQEIEQGQKYVSMECTFNNFSYAIIDAENKCNVIARDENSAWITKHLRAYGGTGEYNGYKFGRLLRNITFSGKGYVDRPANPDSIIFSDAGIFNFSSASQKNPFIKDNGVYFNMAQVQTNEENNQMSSEIEILKAQLDEVKIQLTETNKSKASLEEKLAKADISKFETRVGELEAQLTAANTSIEEITAKCGDAEKKMDDEKKEKEAAQKAKAELEQKLAEMVQAQIIEARITSLVEGGIDREVATKKVALYANLNDEQFKDIATDLVAAWPPAEDKKGADKKAEEDKKKKDSAKCSEEVVIEDTTNADETVLDTAKVIEDASLSVASDVDETVSLRKGLSEAIAARLGIKVNVE